MLSKIRAGTRGWKYATKRLVESGAPPPLRNESGYDWVDRALHSGAFTRMHHPGNLAYAWSVERRGFELPPERHRDRLRREAREEKAAKKASKKGRGARREMPPGIATHPLYASMGESAQAGANLPPTPAPPAAPKRRRERKAKPPPCRVVPIGEGSDEYEWVDPWDLFERVGINIASYEEGLFACVDKDDEVYGVAVGGVTEGGFDDSGEFRFSVAVDPDRQRAGVGRALVRAVKAHYLAERDDLAEGWGWEGVELAAWVINPDMAELLESEGFGSEGSEWTKGAPHMRWSG
jgi:GNAT superfamily N-acetyltransferase